MNNIFLSKLILTMDDMIKLRIRDQYSLHRVVYDLFPDIRTDDEKHTGKERSGILFADKGIVNNNKIILILSNRLPKSSIGTLNTRNINDEFMQYNTYKFEVIINTVKKSSTFNKIVPIIGIDNIAEWFVNKASASYGFSVCDNSIDVVDVDVKIFTKMKNTVTLSTATIHGVLNVTDRNMFISSLCNGMGRGKAFGLGLLQLVPLN